MTGEPTAIGQAAMAIAMIAAFALVLGALFLFRRGAPKSRPILMLVLAVVLVANVLILSF